MHARTLGLLALLLVTAVWGTTFPAMKQLGADLAPVEIIALRFLISTCLLLPLLRGLRRAELYWGGLIGLVLFLAFYLQVSGLAQTSSNRNAFVTGLNVVIVPLLAMSFGRAPGWPQLMGATLAVLGLGGLFYEQAPWSYGDSLTLLGAFVFAGYVMSFEAMAGTGQPLRAERLALVQSATVMTLGVCWLLLVPVANAGSVWQRAQVHPLSLLYLGVVASALMVWLQAWGQQRVGAVDAALMYGLEPVFAAVAAFWWLGEVLRGRALLGGAVIVAGVLLAQLPQRSVKEWVRAT